MTNPAECIIDKFGGLTKTAIALGFPISTVQGWKERARIPQDHWPKIIAAAEKAGFKLGADDFVVLPERAA